MKKISNIFILTILGFVIFIGGVKAEEAKTVSEFPTTSGTYKLSGNIYFDKIEIDGEKVTIELDGQSDLRGGVITLKNGAILSIYRSNNPKNYVDFSVSTIKLLNTTYSNSLILRDVVAGINNVVSYGEYNSIQIYDCLRSGSEPEYKTVLNTVSNINIQNSNDFNKQTYLINFNNDFKKSEIFYNRYKVIENELKVYSAEKAENVEFVLNSIDENEIDTVEIKDAFGSKVEYTKADNKYTFTMPESAVTVTVKYKENSKSEDKEKSEDKVSEEKQESKDNNENKNKTTNPKTSDTIVTSLIIIVLSLLGLDLLMMIKKKINN